MMRYLMLFFFSSRRRHTRLQGDWSSDVCSSDLTSRDSAGATVGPYRPTTFELRLERGAGRARVAVGVLHANTGLGAEGQGVAVVQYGIGSLWEIAPEVSLGVARFGAGLEARVAAGPALRPLGIAGERRK